MDIKFDNLRYLHLLWVVLAMFGVVVYGFARKRQALERFATANLLAYLTAQVSTKRQWIKAILLLTAMVFLVLGIIDPRWGIYYEEIPRRGIDMVFVLDVSRSMLAKDLAPSRLERAKQYIGDVLDATVGDRVGLVTFAGTAMLKCPLTINYGAFRMILDEVTVRSAPRGGTLIGDAVRLAADSFVDKLKEHKAIVVVSDGEDQESYPVEAAKKVFTEQGIRIYTVGLGDEGEGARVPAKDDKSGLYMQHEGQEVWSKMNPKTLREMALAGGGTYVPAGTRNIELGQVLYEDRIAKADKRDFETSRVERYNVQYQWFAAIALLLLLIELWMTDRQPATTRAAACFLAGFLLIAPNRAWAGDPTPHDVVAQANRALSAGDHVKALHLYGEAEKQLPDSPEIAYNEGVANYRKGDYEKAAELFTKALATRDLSLDAKVRFNLGNSAYAQALQKKDDLKTAIEKLQSAISYYRQALEADPQDRDARANIERAQLFIKDLIDKEKQKQEQKKKEEEQKKDKDKQDQSTQPSGQPQSQPSEQQPQSQPSEQQPQSQPSDQQKQDQQAQKQESKDKSDQSQADKKEGEKKEGEKKEGQDQKGKLEGADQDKSKQEQKQAQAVPATQQAMTPEEAQRLLQAVRDKERQRREDQERQIRVIEVPVDRDW